MAFMQYTCQYLVCISNGILSVYLITFIQYFVCISRGISSVYLHVFCLYIWWHLFSITGSIWSVYLMAIGLYIRWHLVCIYQGSLYMAFIQYGISFDLDIRMHLVRWHLFSIPSIIWSAYLMVFIQYFWQYYFCITDGIYSVYLAVFVLCFLMAFGLCIRWHFGLYI